MRPAALLLAFSVASCAGVASDRQAASRSDAPQHVAVNCSAFDGRRSGSSGQDRSSGRDEVTASPGLRLMPDVQISGQDFSSLLNQRCATP